MKTGNCPLRGNCPRADAHGFNNGVLMSQAQVKALKSKSTASGDSEITQMKIAISKIAGALTQSATLPSAAEEQRKSYDDHRVAQLAEVAKAWGAESQP